MKLWPKKIHYRADTFKARDVFDLATVFHGDRRTLMSQTEYFLPHAKTLEERIDMLEKRGELKDAQDAIEILPGGVPIVGQEYHLCKLFLWDLRQRSQDTAPEHTTKPQIGIRR